MKPTKKLVAGLVGHGLVPASVRADNYAVLQVAIRNHVQMGQPNVVWFDTECIDSPDSYLYRADEFYDAMPEEVQRPSIEMAGDGVDMTCRIERNGEVFTRTWEQNADWISGEFIELIMEATRTAHGGFHCIDTQDQTFLAVYLDAKTGKAFTDYSTKDADSREAFLTGQSDYTRRYADIRILSRALYRDTLAAFRKRFMTGDDPLRADAYREGVALDVTLAEEDNALKLFEKFHPLGKTLTAPFNEWHYEAICPEGLCYFLSLDASADEVVFEYEARWVGPLIGDQPVSLGPYLIVGQGTQWGIVVDGQRLIGVGTPVLDALRPVVQDVSRNEPAKMFERLSQEHFQPMMAQLGYTFEREDRLMVETCRHANHWSHVSLEGEQQRTEEPLTITILEGVFHPEIEPMLIPERTEPRSFWSYPRRAAKGSTFSLPPGGDLEAIATAVCNAARVCAERVARDRSIGEWFEYFRDHEHFLRAAAAAVRLGYQNEALELARAGLVDSRKQKYNVEKFYRDQVERLGIVLE